MDTMVRSLLVYSSTKFSMEVLNVNRVKAFAATIPTRTKTVLSGTKSCPNQGTCALAHCPDTGTAHVLVYSHDYAGTPHQAHDSFRM